MPAKLMAADTLRLLGNPLHASRAVPEKVVATWPVTIDVTPVKQKVASLNLSTGAPLSTFGFSNSTNNQVQSLAATSESWSVAPTIQ